jgi:hypothetical protein
MATPRKLDFRPRYDDDELDRLAQQTAETLAPAFEMNGWVWDGAVPSVVEIALAARRLLQIAAESERDGLTILDRIFVERTREDELRVFLYLDEVMPMDVTSQTDTARSHVRRRSA